jgi:4-hydroxy-tetrahydrodipicolinate reductase
MPIQVAIHGAGGRMGQRLVALIAQDPNLRLAAALEAADHPALGQDAGTLAGIGSLGIPMTASLGDAVDVVVDFSVPAAAANMAIQCAELRVPLMLATTGLSAEQLQQVRATSKTVPVCQSPNTSLAVNLVMKLSEIAAHALRDHPQGADVEILERHHRFKADAPSGTALEFGRIISQAMGQTESRHGRHGHTGQRPHHEIGYHAIRAGDNPGEHTVVFGLLGETIELRVAATNRDCYAQGALVAARWLIGKSPGMYTMHDVLGLTDGKV